MPSDMVMPDESGASGRLRPGDRIAEGKGSSAFANGAGKRWMTALGKLFRTTAFKLSLVYLTVFALFAAFLIGYFAWTTSRLITQQISETVDAEINGLSELYGQGGIRRLVLIVDARSRRPGSNLYLVTAPAREGLAGNVGTPQPGRLDQKGLREPSYRRLDHAGAGAPQALDPRADLPGRLPPPARPHLPD